ncbi:MAG: KEOPS complex subunit Pcc1 [Candidatus Heimdallarchaeaceae archaeon]|jgi:hypothetical protein
MGVKNIKIHLSVKSKTSEAARIIFSSLNPDNLTNPPMTIESKVKDNVFEVTISNLSNIETAIATSLDILNSYELSEKIIQNIEE